ncbi:MAG: amidohydrolase [Bacteroidota bacterium]
MNPIHHITTLRKQLHRHPELSGAEYATAGVIAAFIEQHYPARVLTALGETGLAAIYEFAEVGPSILIRCELDALPINEQNDFEHRSSVPGVSHKCGHDGHMAIVAGLIFWIREQEFKSGQIILLFQPAEETGDGAPAVLDDPRFKDLKIDYAFALHNIPGEPMHHVLLMERGFSAEVQSFSIQLRGKESHASQPEQGVNPAGAVALLIEGLAALNVPHPMSDNFALLTPIHINMGQKSYGISPANAVLHYTIRTWNGAQMYLLKESITKLANRICHEQGLRSVMEWFEYFPASVNDSNCNQIIEEAARQQGLTVKQFPTPFRFGEDFGWFSKYYPTAMFGLGAGEETPALHHADYDFPDALLPTGMQMFTGIISQILGETKDDN